MEKYLDAQPSLFTRNDLFTKSAVLVLAVVVALMGTGCSFQASGGSKSTVDKAPISSKKNLPTLKIGVLPARNPQDQEQMIKAFDAYLEKSLGRQVDFQVAKSYSEAVDWLVQEKVDIGYLGPSTYLRALDRGAKVEPLVAPIDRHTGQPWYRACIIVRVDSPIKTLKDLKGKRVAFVDKSSTSGYLMPLASLKKQGIEPGRDFARVLFAGNHSKSMAALEDGTVDAAAANISSYLKRQQSGKLTAKNSRIIWESAPIPQAPIVVSKKLPIELIKQLKQAFINTPDGIEDITGTESAGYTLVSPSDYAPIQQLRKDLNLISLPAQ
ncbi:phosphate/phosphite/phosphonate ABC transporters, periplasmic binding protein [Cylindrospermum stagnale PCC 7417]|uniref:Phosphate/phosphite/phosphonate ABC transporters, periplasmic binding protein n=1 Tax=Cylindrospermum stagnale PCC 7417 TaxID=56107 RepID=K9WU00_9NOST|nr:phosphate/phosphite/phosphonate ABC transporter substrate-binding protein [Cylindrospermum stagnale]AFZ23012.1 phosphate/phosphite/phosphonate ABC transporters, periplasmic binding protein [Cylindrospermum stagnale PCC 7417]